MADNLLDLTVEDRPFVKINGKPYEVRTPGEFSYLAYRKHTKDFQRMGQLLMQKRALTKKEEAEHDRLLDDMARMILLAPDSVHQKLRPEHRLAIVQAFSQLLPKATRTAGAMAGRPRQSRRTGAKRSRG